CKAHQGCVVALGKPGQTALKRQRDIGDSEIEHDQAEAARAQKLLSRDWDACNMKHTDNHQCGEIHSAMSCVGRIKKNSPSMSPIQPVLSGFALPGRGRRRESMRLRWPRPKARRTARRSTRDSTATAERYRL